ncbi:MAG: hypothetical protein OXG52_08235 [bacterium]|nr:hypothetical protein [bacterium]
MARHTNAFPELQRDLRFVPLGVDDPTVLTPEQIDRYNADGFLEHIPSPKSPSPCPAASR